MEETRRDFLKTVGKSAAVVGAAMAGGLPDEASAANTSAKFWKEVATTFMIDPKLHYHNIGGTGAYAAPRGEAIRRRTTRTSRATRMRGMDITAMRTAIAPGFGANADEIVLTTNTTDGMCMSLNGLTGAAGDEIISTNMEHPGGNGPMSHVALRHGVVIKRALLPVGADVQPQQFVDRVRGATHGQHEGDLLFAHPLPFGRVAARPRCCATGRGNGLISIIDGAHVHWDARRRFP